jgi:hypothetical protein
LIYHFDIIIYNKLESPILWTEGNEDQSEQGKFRAIPAKYVTSLFEVKSRLNRKNVKDSLQKLDQTKDFKDQLSPLFFCGIIFIDLKEEDNTKEAIIKELINGKDVHGFSGGLVLRYEGDHTCTGLIRIFESEPNKSLDNEQLSPLAKPIDELNIYLTEEGSLTLAERGSGAKFIATSNRQWSVTKIYGVIYDDSDKAIHLDWSRSGFSDFCIDLLSSLEGIPFNDKNKPSFGQVFDKVETKKAPLQPPNKIDGEPFLELEMYDGRIHGERFTIEEMGDELLIKIHVEIFNRGNKSAFIYEDKFKSKYELTAGNSIVKHNDFSLGKSNDEKNIRDILNEKPIEMNYRIIYHADGNEKERLSIERKLKITAENAEFID